jgi:hypothetical protein
MGDREQGGLTGATGSLTPADPDDEFVPAETREISDPQAARRVTADVHRRADDRGTGSPDTASGPKTGRDDRPQSTRSGGYGSGSGLSAEDPAYRLEERTLPPERHALGDEPVLGGDTRSDPEDEHL